MDGGAGFAGDGPEPEGGGIDRMERLGALLFKWRSFTPLLLLPLAVPLLWRNRGAGGGGAWIASGLVLCALGQALRLWVIGQVPDGTSGQNDVLMATRLNTGGPYARTRNPLYLGNLGITLGLCLVAHEPIVLAAVAALFALQYRAIIAAEEGFLRQRFGADFVAYAARVPRFWPSLGVRVPGGLRPWSLRRALWKEHNPAGSWLAIAVVLVGLDARARGEPLRPWAAALAAVAAAWLGIKAWKHQWLSGGFWRDMRRRVRDTAR